MKRDQEDDGSEDDIGPKIEEAVQVKKIKSLDFEKLYLKDLPCAEAYERSYMHRDNLCFVKVTKTNFVITASVDGHIKFWKKCEDAGIEFVKHFRCHLEEIKDLPVSENGELCATLGADRAIKIFDVINFDMINILNVDFVPSCGCWIYSKGDTISTLAVADSSSPLIRIYDSHGTASPLRILNKLHYKPVTIISFNSQYSVVVSVDESGMIEYWNSMKKDFQHPKCVKFVSKTDTDLYEFAKHGTVPTSLVFSGDGRRFVTAAKDRKIRVFKFLTGKISKILEESLQNISELQKMKPLLPSMEFGKRLAVERDLEKTDSFSKSNAIFDASGNFILYSSLLGVKVINLKTNVCHFVLGKTENARFLHLALFQGSGREQKAATNVETEAADNPGLKAAELDPIVFATAFKRNRFYLFSRREPTDVSGDAADRDVFNEKPSKEEQASVTQDVMQNVLASSVVLHTTMGDITISLHDKLTPKAVENFCVHARNGYYNNHIFHRVIKSFMIQTGDPKGTGTGGESIWGGEFEDEFHPTLRHDHPYTVSMANAGPNTNGSQFFITVVPTPWLDNKHTIFGRVSRGMETVHNIACVKTNPQTDMPHEDIRIINITVR